MQSVHDCACFVRVSRCRLGSILASILDSFGSPGSHYTHLGVTFSQKHVFFTLFVKCMFACVLNVVLRELVRTHVILAPGACGREGQSAGSRTISPRSADVCPSMVFPYLFQQNLDEIANLDGKPLAKHPYGSKTTCFYSQKEP